MPIRRRRSVNLVWGLMLLSSLLAANCRTPPGANPTTPTSPTVVQPQIKVALSAGSVVGGTALRGSITANGTAPTQPLVVNLAASSSTVSLPASVTIPAQGTSVSFDVNTSQVDASTSVRITASDAAVSTSSTADLDVMPIPICGPFLGAPVKTPFAVYTESNDPRNHFIPSGFFGDIGDLAIDTNDRTGPHGGASAIRIDYRPRGSQRFAGIYWQCPENNWGTVSGAGFDLSAARQVQFWARATTSAKAEFKVGGIGLASPPAPYPDSLATTETNPVVLALTTQWQLFTISLAGRNLSRVIGGFAFVTNTDQVPAAGLTLFLDDIVWQ